MDLTGTMLTAAGAFAATNLDNLALLAILFLSHRTLDVPNTWKIWTGQYLGLGGIVVVSVLAAMGLAAVLLQWIAVLGLLPLALGVSRLIRSAQPVTEQVPVAAASLASITAMTLANGGDNVSVYIPLFRSMDVQSVLLTVAAFAVLLGVWCTAASWLTKHPKIINALRRCSHWAVPVVYVLMGVAIMARSGVLTLPMPALQRPCPAPRGVLGRPPGLSTCKSARVQNGTAQDRADIRRQRRQRQSSCWQPAGVRSLKSKGLGAAPRRCGAQAFCLQWPAGSVFPVVVVAA